MVNQRIYSLALILLAVAFPQLLSSQQEQDSADNLHRQAWRSGLEVDALPYVLSGYYASGFAGQGSWRLRGVVSRVESPSFMVSDGFEKKRSDAYALLVDRFVGRNRNRMEGLWFGGGTEFWHNRIRPESTPGFTYYSNFMVTAGGGYVVKLSKRIYLNPWAAVHVVAGGDREINVSGKNYNQPLFTPEASVKIGFVF
jgi:hypothetical protein